MERVVAALCSCKPRFWATIGDHLDPDLIQDERAKLVLQAVRVIAEERGHGPSAKEITIQRVATWYDEGKVTLSKLGAVAKYLNGAPPPPPIEEAIAEIAPLVQRQRQHELLREGLTTWAQRGDMDDFVRRLAGSTRIGQVDGSIGQRVDDRAVATIQRIQMADRMPTGLPELDDVIDNGLVRQGVGMVIGGTGEGKSMFLSHVASEAIIRGYHVLYATLELGEPEVLARVVANLTRVPINSIKDGTCAADAAKRMRMIATHPPHGVLGSCTVKEFTAGATQVHDLIEWVETVETEEEVRPNALIVDYVDRLGGPKGITSSYELGKVIMDSLRNFTRSRDMWTWTASAAKAKTKESAKRRDAESAADSQHKTRISDLVITLNLGGEEEDEISYYVAKHRQGVAHKSVGPYPHEWEIGRMAPVNRGVWT